MTSEMETTLIKLGLTLVLALIVTLHRRMENQKSHDSGTMGLEAAHE